ncbi:hypothetical protein PTKIN_Ptkin05aG0192700 [Pterospermum kingtungense]
MEKVAKALDAVVEGVVEERHKGIQHEKQKDFVDVLLEIRKENKVGFPVLEKDSLKALLLGMGTHTDGYGDGCLKYRPDGYGMDTGIEMINGDGDYDILPELDPLPSLDSYESEAYKKLYTFLYPLGKRING